jgi:hypothetical protein
VQRWQGENAEKNEGEDDGGFHWQLRK